MIEIVKELLSKEIEEIIASPLSLKLLSCYSVLYLGGGQPKICAKSQRSYYQELKKTGMEKATKFEETKKRTLVPMANGLLYNPKIGHINMVTLTDEEAIKYLKRGILREAHFKVLPEGFLKKEEPKKQPKKK